MDTTDTLDTAKYARIVGVFRDRAKADQAVEALKQAGMSDVELMVYDLIVLQKKRLVTLPLKAALEQRKHQVMRMLSA